MSLLFDAPIRPIQHTRSTTTRMKSVQEPELNFFQDSRNRRFVYHLAILNPSCLNNIFQWLLWLNYVTFKRCLFNALI